MYSVAILGVGLCLEAAILLRGALRKLWSHYPFFYFYVGVSLAGALALTKLYLSGAASYWQWYWVIQFATLLLGCGLVLELFGHVLGSFPGAVRFAKFVVLTGFGTIVCFALAYSFFSLRWSPSGTEFELERDLRTLQAIFLALIIVLISYYRIELGKNIRGMLLGYVLYVAASLGSMALRSYVGRSFNGWMFVPPLCYDVSLAIWLVALWSYYPVPVPKPGVHLEADYESLVAVTKTALGAVRSQLGRTARP